MAGKDMQDFRNLQVWQKAHELVLVVYDLTQDFPKEELFGLRHSLRRTCVDIPAYIAEGSGKASDSEFSRCIGSALGLANRLEYFVLLAFDLKLLSEPSNTKLSQSIVELKKRLNAFNRSLRT
ncbi:MAG: four helix bundle protein [Acidobacteria bacterium]|nr:four helix bundle protein [Acidobacteriota bacterium]